MIQKKYSMANFCYGLGEGSQRQSFFARTKFLLCSVSAAFWITVTRGGLLELIGSILRGLSIFLVLNQPLTCI